jgi:hypothetical protein
VIGTALDEVIAWAQSGFNACLQQVATARGVTLTNVATFEKFWDWRLDTPRTTFPVLLIEWEESESETTRPAAGVRDSRHTITVAYVMNSQSSIEAETHVKHVGEAFMLWLDTWPTATRTPGKTIVRLNPPKSQGMKISAPVEQVRKSGATNYVWRVAVEFVIETRDPSPTAAVASMTVTPNPVTVAPLAMQQLTATPKDAGGNPVGGRPIGYITESAAVATVDANGLITGIAGGSTNVYVWCDGVIVTVPVTVQTGAWVPTSSANLELWLKGDAGITIGTGVSQWADQSGNGRNFTQGTGTKQPLNSNTLNGLPVVTFQRANSQYLQQSAGVNMPSGACTVFVVYKLRSTPAGGALWNLYHFISDSRIEEAIAFGNGNGFGNFNFLGESGPGTTLLRTIPDAWDTNAHQLSMTFAGKYQANNASFGVRLGETTKVVSANGGGNYAVSGQSISSIGAFRNDLEVQFMDGDIAEILHYSRVLSAGEIASAEAYLTARWGV